MKKNVKKLSNRWLIAIMGTLLQASLGTLYAWSYFQNPVMNTCNWTNAQVAWAFSLAMFFLGVAATWGGINLPKYGPQKLAVTCGVLYSLGYFIAAYALDIKSLPLFYVGYGVIGGLGLGIGCVVPVATAAKWFPDRKGLITGMVIMGFGFGALIMAKLIAPNLMLMTDHNLVQVFSYIGIMLLITTLPAGFCLVNPPADFMPKGYRPQPNLTAANFSENALTAKQCILSLQFFMMWTILFINIIVGIMFISFQSPLLQDLLKRNLDPNTLADQKVIAELAVAGATLIAASSVFNGLGRIFWGGLSDKIGRVQTFRLILGSQLFVFIALIFVTNPVVFSILVCYVLLCYGGGLGAMPSFVSDVFGPKLMPVIYGSILTASGCGGIVGPQIVACMKDNFSSQAAQYTFMTAAVLLLFGLMIALKLKNQSSELVQLKLNVEFSDGNSTPPEASGEKPLIEVEAI